MATKPILYGAEYCPICAIAKKFLDTNNIEYTYKDVSLDPDEFVNQTGERKIPVLLLGEKKLVGFEKIKYDSVFNL